MQRVVKLNAKAGPDGKIHVEIPVEPDRAYTIIVTAAPVPISNGPPRVPAPVADGWPPGYFESTFGSIQDEAFDALLDNRPAPPPDSP